MADTEPCLFCRIVAGDIPATIAYSNEHVVGFNDINPQAPVHVLFVPRTHISTVNDIADDQASVVGQLLLAARDYAREAGVSDEGFRLVMNCNENGGQTVFHVHLHLLAGARLPGGFGTRQ
ncbi:MAG: histidine triad nucleotide-binding protein [Pseudomonadota bacterium]